MRKKERKREKETRAPIGTRKCNFSPFSNWRIDRPNHQPTDQQTDQQTDMRAHRKVTLPKKIERGKNKINGT